MHLSFEYLPVIDLIHWKHLRVIFLIVALFGHKFARLMFHQLFLLLNLHYYQAFFLLDQVMNSTHSYFLLISLPLLVNHHYWQAFFSGLLEGYSNLLDMFLKKESFVAHPCYLLKAVCFHLVNFSKH